VARDPARHHQQPARIESRQVTADPARPHLGDAALLDHQRDVAAQHVVFALEQQRPAGLHHEPPMRPVGAAPN